MQGLLGPDGQPIQNYIQQKSVGRPKTVRPIMGEAFGGWAGADNIYLQLPGGGAIMFDTSKLTLADYRKMSEHYQISSSLNVITFMMQQLDWHIECEDKQVEEHCTYVMSSLWNRLIRSMCSSFIFGYSPNILQYENDEYSGRIIISKVKDLVHEDVMVNWKEIDGYAPPGQLPQKVKIFDGIRRTNGVVIPQTNSFWYPLLMKNGDYYGRKLLNTAFQPWFFSSLIHLYQNRYFERFGEPVPVGRAPYDDKIKIGGKEHTGADLMAQILSMIKNRSAVVLPNDTTPQENGTDKYDYTVEYLESQMRGADFEVYLKRLDEEMSLALFTPLLLLRTADGGGFNQGVSHQQQFLWILNALAADFKEYIDRYILRPLSVYAFNKNAKRPEIKFRKLGKAQQETLRAVLQSMLNKGELEVDVEELGQHTGLTLKKVEKEEQDDPELDAEGNPILPSSGPVDRFGRSVGGNKGDKRIGRPERLRNDDLPNITNTRATTRQLMEQVVDRVGTQVKKAYRDSTFDQGFTPALGFARQLRERLEDGGHADADGAVRAFTERTSAAIAGLAQLGTAQYATPDEFMERVKNLVEKAHDMYLMEEE